MVPGIERSHMVPTENVEKQPHLCGVLVNYVVSTFCLREGEKLVSQWVHLVRHQIRKVLQFQMVRDVPKGQSLLLPQQSRAVLQRP